MVLSDDLSALPSLRDTTRLHGEVQSQTQVPGEQPLFLYFLSENETQSLKRFQWDTVPFFSLPSRNNGV